MFAKLSTLALALPLVSALTINSLESATTGSTVTITWTASTSDPAYFSIELVNPAFNNEYAIANNVQTSLGTLTIQLPQVPPGGGYNIEAIAINNVGQIYSESGSFSIGAATTSSTSAGSTTPSATSASSVTVSTPSTASTTPVSSGSVASVATSGTSTAASSSPTVLTTGGAASFKVPGMVPAAALVLSAVAGAVMVF